MENYATQNHKHSINSQYDTNASPSYKRTNVEATTIKYEIADEEVNKDPSKTIHYYKPKLIFERGDSYQSSAHGMEHTCPECNRSFSKNQYLILHLKKTHTKEVKVLKSGRTLVKCDMCPYESDRHMTRHMKMVHTIEDKKFKCELCPYATEGKSDLKKHIEGVHEKIRSQICKECGYAASEKGTLRRHILRKHEKIKRHVCNECGKAFPLKYDLKLHEIGVHKAQI